MDELETGLDYLLVDTGAGINDNVLYFNLAVQERLVVLTPEPTSLTDAYALIKVMQQNHGVHEFRILVNLAPDMKAAREVFGRLYKACDHFLAGVALDFAGMVPRDAQVRNAVIAQKPFCVQDAGGPACRAVTELAKTIQTWDVPDTLDGNIKFFWKRLLFRT
jgi:flagellar biosynthesis protein FlhG